MTTEGIPHLSSRPPGVRAVPQAPAQPRGVTWVYAYIVIQFLCQLALLLPALAPLRIVFRGAAFGTSLLFFALIPGSPLFHNPLRVVLTFVIGVLTLSWMNPEGGGFVAASAHWLFHLAILAPVFWVARLRIDERGLERLALLMWAFYAASAAMGVLQAAFPGRFQPTLSVVISDLGKEQVMALSIRLSSGDWIIRPMGLTDLPGGAGYGGFYATLLGLGVVLAKPFSAARPIGAISMLLGAVSVYMCQIRTLLVMLGVCMVALVVISALAGRTSRFVMIGSISCFIAVVGFSGATSLGGDAVTSRLATLVTEDASSVYYRNRGVFVEHTILNLIPEYPIGAGLGRWGMMSHYFSTPGRSLWAEIQWTGWLYDGGVLLLILYPAAIVLVIANAARLALAKTDTRLATWAAIIFAYDVGSLALTFSYPNFMATAGIEFWVLNAALLQAAGSAGVLLPSAREAVAAAVRRVS